MPSEEGFPTTAYHHSDVPRVFAGPVRWLHRVENGLVMFFGTFLTILIAGLVEFSLEPQGPSVRDAERWPWFVAAALWVVLDLPLLWRLWRLWRVAFSGSRHFALDTARRQPVPPLPLRPVVGAWWLAHFALGVTFALMTKDLDVKQGPAAECALGFFMATSYGYAANGYLLVAIRSLTRSDRVLRAVWYNRLLLDAALGVAGALIPAGFWHMPK